MSSRRYFSRSPVPGERSRSSRPPGYHALSPSRSSHGRSYYSRNRAIANGGMPSHHLSSSSGSRGWTRPGESSLQSSVTTSSERKEVSSVLSLNELPARERLLVPEVLDAEETTVVERTIDAFKSRGHFDDFRKEFLDAMEQMPRYKSLRYMVMSTVSKYTARQGPFHPGMRKPVMRDGLREELMRESNGLSTWINDLVDDLIGPNIERRIRSVVQDTLEDFIPDEKTEVASYMDQENQPLDPNVMAAVTNGMQAGGQRPERLPTPPPLVKHYSEQLAMAKIESERQEQITSRLPDVSAMRGDANSAQLAGVPVDMEEDTIDGVTSQSPIAPVPIDDEVANGTQSATVKEEVKAAGVMPQLLFNQLAHFSMYPQDAPPELREALLSSSVAPASQSSTSSQKSQSTVEMSVMVDEPPTGVEDIISPEMMDIEDGHSPDPNSHNSSQPHDTTHNRRRNGVAANSETWSADESATTTATTTTESLDQDYRFMSLSTEMPVLTPATAPFSMDSPVPSDVSNSAATSNPASPIKSRSTLGSLLLEKRKLKMKSVVSKPTPIRKGSNSDIESISSESDFGSSSSSSSESNSSGDEDSVSKQTHKPPKSSGRPKLHETPELASKIEMSDRDTQRISSSIDKEASRKDTTDGHRQTHRDREPELDQLNEHVSRYGRRGRQPRRYSPDAERRRGSPGFSESPSSSSRTTPRKSQKSTPKRFYPGNSPSMLLKRKRSPSPQVKTDVVSAKRERTPEERKQFKHEKSEQRYEERIQKPEPFESSSRHREQRSPSSSKVASEKRPRKEMPKVHLSSRRARNDDAPQDHMHQASDQKLTLSRDRHDKSYLPHEKEKRSASRDASSQSEIDETKSEVRLKPRESRSDHKRSESLYMNSEKEFKEKKFIENDKEKLEVGTPPLEVEDASVNASTEEYQQSSAKETTTDESKMDISIDTDSSPKKEKEKAKKEADDLEEGEISDDSDSSHKPPSEIGSPTFSKSTTKEPSPPLKATKLFNDLSKLKAEFPPAPPPLPPLKKKKRKKGKRSSESSSSESDDSDDSLIERLTKKDTKRGPTTRPPPVQNYPPNEMMIISDHNRPPPPAFGGGGGGDVGVGYMYSAIVDDREERKRSGYGAPQMMSKVVSEEMPPMVSRQLQRGGRNKDSWRALSPEFHEKGKLSPPPMIYEKAMPKIRLSTNEKDAMRRSKPKQQELPPPPPLTRKVPYPPPPMASLDDEPSTGSDSNQSSSSEESTSSSSSAESNLKSKKLKSRKQYQESKRSTPGSSERHQRKLHHNSGSKHEVSSSHRSSSRRLHEVSSSKGSGSRHYDVQKWASTSNYNSRYEDTSKHTDDDQRCSSQASSDEVLVSNSHTPPRGR